MGHETYTFCSHAPDSWSDARELMHNLHDWVFRGQGNCFWNLSTTLERAALATNCDQRKIPQIEGKILEQFQRRASQYLPHIPENNNYLEWFSLIQHHGGPTRLLDFTHSPYVASFFAVERNSEGSNIFCLNRPLLERAGISIENQRNTHHVHKYGTVEYCNEVLGEQTSSPLVMISEPFNMNERLAAQQGLFAIPFEGQQTFEYNLSLTFNPSEKELPRSTYLENCNDNFDLLNDNVGLLIIIIRDFMNDEIKKDLHHMNINAATLYPGLDGFARSLYSRFEFNS